ncbi:MAG: hypothetical protein JXQ99_22690, partial [Hyphomicrobiaceae bacterium]
SNPTPATNDFNDLDCYCFALVFGVAAPLPQASCNISDFGVHGDRACPLIVTGTFKLMNNRLTMSTICTSRCPITTQ